MLFDRDESSTDNGGSEEWSESFRPSVAKFDWLESAPFASSISPLEALCSISAEPLLLPMGSTVAWTLDPTSLTLRVKREDESEAFYCDDGHYFALDGRVDASKCSDYARRPWLRG